MMMTSNEIYISSHSKQFPDHEGNIFDDVVYVPVIIREESG